MTRKIGGNLNTNSVATVTTIEVNSVTPTIISVANANRIFFYVTLDTVLDDIVIFVRLYPAAQDTIDHGIPLAIATTGNNNIFTLTWEMPSTQIYTGEISAMTIEGTANLIVTEY